ncbi:MAG TPA: glutamate--tRNA ligase [Povalibacter sp.]|nr:glutamate--tRNA ligase [Povalibacter sp.]
MTIRTRFAPSPTGLLHIGGVRTALFSWLYAKRNHGTFVLRIEDTDRERSTGEATQVILDGMEWLGLRADEGPFYQTRRMDRYRAVLADFVSRGHAYRCYCSKEELETMRNNQLAAKLKPRYDGTCRNRSEPRPGVDPVIRFANPLDGVVVVQDVIHGDVVFQNAELDDLIIARSDGTPTYNFCVVVDDMDMKITHVIRGDDHLNNTPRQINMLEALGAQPPVYGHVPMILGADGAKLSKRHGAVSVLQYRDEGYLPEALLNYLVRLGWSHGDQEVFSLEEMQQLFDIHDVNKSASAFNPDKLLWLNQQHIMRASPAALVPHLKFQLAALGVSAVDDDKLAAVAKVLQERAKTLKEMAQKSTVFFGELPGYEEKAAKKSLTSGSAAVLRGAHEKLAALPTWSAVAIHEALNDVAASLGVELGKVAQPIRVAVSGTSVSPPIDGTLEVLGREMTLQRLEAAAAYAASH